ncbi:MAG: hypothetical protein Q4D16_19685 [Eubacteriales bacterium]|nr:hypothetical protein [Eubacteriales bacterium]
MDYIQLSMDDYIQSKQEIKENIGGIVKSFVRIGWQLTRIDKSRAYELDGYKSIADFAKSEYDMNPSGVSRFMRVYEKYSLPGDTPELQEQYRDFKFAQLVEMLQLPEADRDMFWPEAKREDIREMQRFNKENENNPENLMNWQQDQPEDKLSKTILEFFREHREILNDIYASEAYRTGNIKEMVEIINPSGNRSYRKGTVFLMLYSADKGIMVKEFGKDTQDITWDRFFTITQEIFGEAAAGSRTYETYFGIKESEEEPKEPQKEPEKPEESQKTAPGIETPSHLANTKADTDFAPAQTEPQKGEKSQETAPEQPKESKSVPQPESPEEPESEEQLPGQDNIQNHPEYMPQPEPPEPEIAPAQQTEVPEGKLEQSQKDAEILDKPTTRKDFIESRTPYGAAEYLAKAFEGFKNVTYNELRTISFWESWLNAMVDHAGRPWIE